MSAGVFGYLSYDTVRLVEKLPSDKPDPVGVPDAFLMRPAIMVIFDAVKDEMTVVTTVRPQKRISGQGRLFARAGAARPNPGCARHQKRARAFRRWPRRQARGHNVEHDAQGLHGHGRQVEGVHRGRRYLPGRAVAALLRRASTCRPSRSTGRCAASTRRPSSIS